MGYPEDALAQDEELILHRHPHWKMLVLPALTFVLATAVAGFLLGLTQDRADGTTRTVLSISIGAIWLGVVLWRSVAPFTVWKFTHFIVTDRRVLIRHGVLTHTGIDIPMGRISNVQFRHGLIDRMLKTGTLVIASASDDPLEFDDIPDVEQVHAMLYHQVFDSTLQPRERNRPDDHYPADHDADDENGW
ncbi:PH domain-containing protein [Rhodococcus sp. IEGM 1379]|uniref:PH domain-containing protein n=1 Tax=Rhodococcus sp. IEGM 1379 TaxID=3047086 RepID=UPI0024B74C48|nr:PH domain-containing protein [Rhodococcus sp. IEGM 1379]MDI9914813.1 PH domain-containing protein [Rhodococcus sp. IEGM 1379]